MNIDVIVIGAGPAGLAAAAALKGLRVLVLEGQASAGKKLLLSGGGQCNVTHEGYPKDFYDHYGQGTRFVRTALSKFPPKMLRHQLSLVGVETFAREDGKVFPKSLEAGDVLTAFFGLLKAPGTQVSYNEKVKEIKKTPEGFRVVTSVGAYSSRYVVLAAGGASYPMTGSDGSGCGLAENLGHAIVPLRPSLSPVYVTDHVLRDLSGLSFTGCTYEIHRRGQVVGKCGGDILVTHKGFSGPGIINHARDLQAGDHLRIVWSNQWLAMEKALLAGGKKQVETVLAQFLAKRMAGVLCQWAQVAKGTTCAELKKDTRKKLQEAVGAFPVEIAALGALKSAMATAGGVSLAEVNGKTMASRLVEGLYFAGEVLDIDGDTGGYNIQWAWSSGQLAGEMIQKATS